MPNQWTVFGESKATGETRLVITGPAAAAEALHEAKQARPDFKPTGEPQPGNVQPPRAETPAKK